MVSRRYRKRSKSKAPMFVIGACVLGAALALFAVLGGPSSNRNGPSKPPTQDAMEAAVKREMRARLRRMGPIANDLSAQEIQSMEAQVRAQVRIYVANLATVEVEMRAQGGSMEMWHSYERANPSTATLLGTVRVSRSDARALVARAIKDANSPASRY